MPSCASLLTWTTASRMTVFIPAELLCSCALASLTIVLQHRRSFVFKVLVKELSIRSIIIRWRYPFPWYDAWESYTYASGAIQPARCHAPSELLAEIRGEVIAVLGEEIVGCALEFLRGLAQVSLVLE